MNSDATLKAVSNYLRQKFGVNTRVFNARPLSGGCINRVLAIESSAGNFCLKANAEAPEDFFEAEENGLATLAPFVQTPEVIARFSDVSGQNLLLQYFSPANPTDFGWRRLAEDLARLHRQTAPTFGFEHNNYIGALRQINTPKDNFAEFFIENRLEPLVRLACETQKFERADARAFEKLYPKLENYFPPEKPALLHGDLWYNNILFTAEERPILLDPAVYYGMREAELAFSAMCGGFPHTFYDAYSQNFPLENGYSERAGLYNLYPLLVHVNLFGGAYVQETRQTLRRYL